MRNLGSLLERFKNFKNPKEEKEELVTLVSRCLGFDIPYEGINLKKEILYLDVSGYLKNEVFMKKEIILKSLKEQGYKKIEDIR